MKSLFRRGRTVSETAPLRGCKAPWVAMRLTPNGSVLACCVNENHVLGNVEHSSLSEIWNGPRVQKLRDAVGAEDYSLGCEACGDLVKVGLRSHSHAADYDHYKVSSDLSWPQEIEFALSNTCNLQCIQCNGDLSSAIRSQREHRPPLRSPYGDEFFEQLTPFLPHLTSAAFIGGEPFLMRESRRVWDQMIEMKTKTDVWVTTNGTVWDDRVEHYVYTLKMGVSISIDSMDPAVMAAIRVGADLDKVLKNRDRFREATRSYGKGMKLNMCVMPQNWHEFFDFLLGADEMDCLVYPARVFRPAELSLYHLPTNELRHVVETMNEQGTEAHRLTINRPIWNDMLADLTSFLDGRGESEVAVPEPVRRGKSEAQAIVNQALASLAARSTEAPVVVKMTDGKVAPLEIPEWAQFLGLDTCIGLDGNSVAAIFVERLGDPLPPEPDDDADGMHRRVWEVDRNGVRAAVQTLSIETTPGDSEVLIGLLPR